YIKNKVNNMTFLPKQRISSNGVIPYQLHYFELSQILNNASNHYDFLRENDNTGINTIQKISKLMEFRIPYYIGPLNPAHKNDKSKFTWIERLEKGKVLPWNFEQKIDIDNTAEGFIKKMTRKCSYLKGKDVLPKNSLLYSEYSVLNELNNLHVNGQPLEKNLKQKIFNQLFKKKKKVTQKNIKDFLISESIFKKGDQIDLSGIDGDFKNSLSSFISFSRIFQDIDNDYELQKEIEKIIFILTIFENRDMAIKRISKEYSNITKDQLKEIKKLNFIGWGKLSREFLEDLVYNVDSTGQPITIMYLMRNENKNLQEALYDVRYNLIKKVNEVNKGFLSEDNNYEGLMKDVYVSPGIKRSLWQALKIVDEVKKIIKQPIDRFFVEVARGGGKKGDRKLSRKLQISSLYKNAKVDKKEIEEMAKKLNLETDNNLRSDKLFYYYMQLGKCMYTNNPIDIDKLNTNAYDIDHIIPRAYLKDDSLNNRVLVERNANALKGDRYPISSDVQDKMKDFWKKLLSVKLITNEKYQRLTRSNDLTDEEKGEFINRQLVFTNQAVKALNEILIKDNPESKIIYSKASNVSIFRQDFGLLKSREINDFHHAHDAYLNIVVGNTYYTKFGTNAIYFFKNQKDKESFVNTNKLFYRNTPSAWNSDGSSKKTVLKMLDLKDILVTKMVTEKKFDFYDETIYPKKDGDKLFPLKTKDTRYLDTNKYGGYKSLKIAYFMIVKHDKGKKSIITIEGMPVIHDYKIKNNELSIQEVLVDYLGLVNPIVLVSKIKAGTLIKLDKAYANLAGKAKNDIITHNANQLYLSQDLTQYFRLIEKYIATQYKKEEIESYALDTYEVSVSKKESEPNPTIDKIKNLKLYDELLYKFQCGLYDGLTMQKLKEELADVRASFKEINVLQQAYSLYELIKIMHCNASTGNLSMFMEKASNKGSNTISKNITDKNITIYDESITGFYRKVRWQNQ
ncbi:MAG: type II CRISPR RNA-guided endonuclease Cas9, partial [Candidatus Izemoplasmatales bacterium]